MSLNISDITEAEKRLKRFAPYIKEVFPETKTGTIESPLTPIRGMKQYLEKQWDLKIDGNLFLKCDNLLPISGSVKARGGIYEVLKHAEKLAAAGNLISAKSDYSILNTDTFKQFFSGYTLAVGSTGNLGLSIGIMGRALGFKVAVHMSRDAKDWKKKLLRDKGANVIEYDSDYSTAVEKGRIEAGKDPFCYFIDDENSTDLFCGYAAAANHLKRQLTYENIIVDREHPLFVYLKY